MIIRINRIFCANPLSVDHRRSLCVRCYAKQGPPSVRQAAYASEQAIDLQFRGCFNLIARAATVHH
jgi:hypothetical protein